MSNEFESLTEESGIKNARLIAANWLEAEGIQGDVLTTSDVTYFVRDIVPFIEKMEAAPRRGPVLTGLRRGTGAKVRPPPTIAGSVANWRLARRSGAARTVVEGDLVGTGSRTSPGAGAGRELAA